MLLIPVTIVITDGILLRLSGRPTHVAKLRSEFDAGL